MKIQGPFWLLLPTRATRQVASSPSACPHICVAAPHCGSSPWLLSVAPPHGSSPVAPPRGASPGLLQRVVHARALTATPAAPLVPPPAHRLLPVAPPHRCRVLPAVSTPLSTSSPTTHWSTHKSQALSSPSADSALVPNVDEHFKSSRHQTPRVTSPCPSPASPGHAPRSAPAPRCFDLRLSSRPPIWMPTLAQPLPGTSRETSQGKPGSGRPRPAPPPAAPLLGGHSLTGTSPAPASAPPHADCCTNSRRCPGLNTSGPPASNQPHGFSSNRRAVACPPPAAEQTGKSQAQGGKGVGAAAGT